MATRSVTVLTVHGRRQTVKVEPNMTVLQILETVCRKYNFPHDEYDLLHHNKVLDLSAMFRFSGLPNNAQLEMAKAKKTRTEEDVIVQLQLVDGTRTPNGTFRPSTVLLDVLRTLQPERAHADAHPVLVYMRREMYWNELPETTLKSLGLTRGRAAIRLLQRCPDVPQTQANVSTPLAKTVVPETTVTTVTRGTQPEPDTNTAVPLSEVVQENIPTTVPRVETVEPSRTDDTEPVDGPSPSTAVGETPPVAGGSSKKKTVEDVVEKPRPEAKIVIVGERQAVVYHASTGERDHAEVSDSFFELTVPEMKRLYQELQDRVKAYENMPLLTGDMRELERNQQVLRNMGRYRYAVIRVQFPDRHILQGVFQVFETIGAVMEFVRGFLADHLQPFYLYTTPPKNVLQPTASLVDAHCFPQVLLHFSYTEADASSDRYLRPALLDQLSNACGASHVAARAKRTGTADDDDDDDQSGPSERRVNEAVDTSGSTEPEAPERVETGAGCPNRIPNRNFRQSSTTNATVPGSSEREAKILKFLKK